MYGQSLLKIAGQNLPIFILLAFVPLLLLKRDKFVGTVFRLLVTSFVLLAIAEIIPTFHTEAAAPAIAAGCLLNLFAYYLLYKAVAQTVPSAPFVMHQGKAKSGGKNFDEGRDFFAEVLDASGSLVIVLDFEGRIVRCNKVCEFTTGYLATEIQGKCMRDIFQVPDEFFAPDKFTGRTNEARLPKPRETRLRTKTGNVRLIEWTGAILPVRGSDERYVIITGIDNTKCRATEEELQQSMARYRSLYNNTPVMLHSLDNDGRIINVSDYWLKVLHYERIEVIGRKFVEFLTESSRRHIETVVFPGYLKVGFCEEICCGVVNKTGGEIEVLLSIMAERNGDGNINRSLSVMVDVTERKRAQREIEELNLSLALRAGEIESANHELEKLNNSLEARLLEEVANNRKKDFVLIQQSRHAAMGEMIGNIAHQWRQPLNALGLIVQDLQESYEYGELTGDYLKENVGRAMDVIVHMSQTISDFRNFFSPDKVLVSFDVADAINKAVNFVSGSFNDQDIHLDVAAEADVFAFGLPNEYSQVLLNILNNAREAIVGRGVTDGRIKIDSCKNNDRSVVTISDNAGGIPPDIIDRIFDPYFTTKESGGTGIGLYMSKTIIEKHMNGKLSVTNNGNGAEFRIEV